MKRKNLTALLASMLLFFFCWAGCVGAKEGSQSASTTTVILIRHVERDNLFVVTPQGHKRARALIDTVGDMGITAVYSPDLERNLDTISPLAKHLGIEITLIPRFTQSTIGELVSEILIKHRGEVILIVGNGSGNLRTLHQRLGGSGEGPYQYGDLFTYSIPDQGPVKVKKSKYGS